MEFHGPVPEEDLVELVGRVHGSKRMGGFWFADLGSAKVRIPVVIRGDAHIPEEVGRHCFKAMSARHMADILYEILTDDTLKERVARTGLEYSSDSHGKQCSRRL